MAEFRKVPAISGQARRPPPARRGPQLPGAEALHDPSAVLRQRPAHAVAMDLVGKALDAATSPNVVKKSFRSTGILPWEPDLILEHAKIFTSKNLTDGDLSSTSDPVALARGLAAAVLEENNVLPRAGRRRARVWNNKAVSARGGGGPGRPA